ncbi:Hypothetical protein, putative [Bodo saltans]|uniref:Uncharacterized protein n=1 Tax=Bodo saltans TaxID=75058 RepID=A0A0S4KIE8_BODSA|nr:Hypothetical protein, putative [Bodo saltans]|eukprot:CUI15468.1 Hypothetical protein, putative [Bodo saltans]
MRCNARCLLNRNVLVAKRAVVPAKSTTIHEEMSVSDLRYRDIRPFVNITYNRHMLFPEMDPDESLLTRNERVFLDVDFNPVVPAKLRPPKYDLRASIDRTLMQELHTKYGDKIKGFNVDPATHALLWPAELPCSVEEVAAMSRMHENYNTGVYKDVTDVFEAMCDGIGKAKKKKGKLGGNIDTFVHNWLRLSGFTSGASEKAFRLKAPENRSFPWRGGPQINVISDFVVQTRFGDFVVVVQDNAGFWKSSCGNITEVFGEALCCMYRSFFTNRKRRGVLLPTKIHAVRLYNHHAAFFTLHATEAQIDAVCHHKDPLQVPGFTKMTLESDIVDPAFNWRRLGMSSSLDYLGFDISKNGQRRDAQMRMATLREVLK